MRYKKNYYIEEYYKITKYAMTVIGHWPYQSINLAKCFITSWIVLHISIITPEMIKLVEVRHDGDDFIECFCPIIFNVAIAFKFYNGIVKREKIKEIIDKIHHDWEIITDDKEIKILRKHAEFGKLITVGYSSMCVGTLFIYLGLQFTPQIMDVLKPLNTSRHRAPIFPVEFFVDEDKYFYQILAHSYVTSLNSAIPIIATDTFFVSSVQHACAMFTILGKRLKKINKEESKSRNDSYREAVICAIQHNAINEYCDCVNNAYSDSFFYILGINMIIMSFTGVLTILKWGSFHDMIRNGIFAVAQMFHLYYYSFQGQELMDQSVMLRDYIFNSGWYTAPVRTRKILAIMIMRSLKPIKLTAKVFIMSLPNFTIVTKTSMSYFTVLKSSR